MLKADELFLLECIVVANMRVEGGLLLQLSLYPPN